MKTVHSAFFKESLFKGKKLVGKSFVFELASINVANNGVATASFNFQISDDKGKTGNGSV